MGLRALLVAGLFVVAVGCASSTPPPCAPVQTAPESASNAPPGVSASASRAGPAGAGGRSVSPPADELDALSDEDLVRRLLTITGAAALGKQVLDSMAESLKRMPGLPPGFMERFQANAKPEDLTTLIVPIYVRNYRRETIIAAIRFYESEQGQLLVEKMPAVTKETTDAGREWGKQLAARTLRELGAVPSKSP